MDYDDQEAKDISNDMKLRSINDLENADRER